MSESQIDVEPFIQRAITRELILEDVRAYCRAMTLASSDFYNILSWAIAERFDGQLMSFKDADYAMNEIYAIMTSDIFAPHGISKYPEPAYSIFLAFDEGEYFHGGQSDPVESFTRPLVKKILADKNPSTKPL